MPMCKREVRSTISELREVTQQHHLLVIRDNFRVAPVGIRADSFLLCVQSLPE